MPLIAEAYAGRVEMLNAIFGGGQDKPARQAPRGRGGRQPALVASGADIGTGLRALAALNRRGG